MGTENVNDEIEIDLKELFRAILSKFVIIVLVGILGAMAAFAYTKVLVTPKYTSTTEVYIRNETEADTLTTSDLAFASYIALDLQELIESEPILKQVIQDLNLNVTTKTLSSWISVSLIEDTRILKIDVSTDNPEMSQQIADKVRDVATVQTKKFMGGVEAINKIDDASLPSAPSSPNVTKNVLIGFAGGAMLVIVIVIILFLMDDTIKTQEDIEKYLGISVLASIPVQKNKSSDESGSNKKRKKK